jgi:hypothetical protein
LNWDFYQHQLLAEVIQGGNFSFFTSELSDSYGFASYPPLFHLNLALSQGFAPLRSAAAIETFWNLTSFFHLLLWVAASACLAWAFTKSRKIALVTALISAFIFDGVMSMSNLFLLPQTTAALIAMFCLADTIARPGRRWWKMLLLTFTSVIILVLSHFVIGSAAAGLLIVTTLYFCLPFFQKKIPLIIFGVLVAIFSLAMIFVSRAVDLSALNHGEAAVFTFTASEKIADFNRYYGYGGFIFWAIGLGLAGHFVRINRRRRAYFWLLALNIVMLAVIFSSFPYTLKFVTLAKTIFELTIAIAIVNLLGFLNHFYLKVIAVLVLLVYLGSMFVNNDAIWKQSLYYQGNYLHVSDEELKVADWLRAKYLPLGQSVLLISDPSTQQIFEGLSHVNTPGGSYMSAGNRQKVVALYQDPDIERFFDNLGSVSDNLVPQSQITKRLLVMAGRTFSWWQAAPENQLSFGYGNWQPQDFNAYDQLFALSLRDDDCIKKVYQSDLLMIFEYDRISCYD